MTTSIVLGIIGVLALAMFARAALTYNPHDSLGAYMDAEITRLEALAREREVVHMERDLLHVSPREWVRQAEQAVERAERGRLELDASLTQMERTIASAGISANEYVHRLSSHCDPAPRFACVTCGMYDAPHTHDLEDQ